MKKQCDACRRFLSLEAFYSKKAKGSQREISSSRVGERYYRHECKYCENECRAKKRRRHGILKRGSASYHRKFATYNPLILARSPRFQRGESHINAKDWILRAPDRRIYKFRNLLHFVRRNPKLFNPSDRATQRKAYGGLVALNPSRKNPHGSWKGWTWGANFAVADRASRGLRI
jgi:hypothetical protein